MGRKKKTQKKDQFEDLSEEFKTQIVNSSREDIEHHLASVALQHMELKQAQKDDGDLAEKKAAYKAANEMYVEGFKTHKMKLEFMRRVLNDKGGLTKNP